MRALVLFSLCLAASCTERFSRAAQRPIHLTSGDSLVIIATGPIVVPNQPRGLMVRFYPYAGLADTNRLKAQATELWAILRRQLDSTGVPWVALQATNQTPGPKFGVFNVQNYGFVFKRRGDGQWYYSGDTKPLSVTP